MEPITPLTVYRDHYTPGDPKSKPARDHRYVPIKLGGLSNAPEKYKPEVNKGWISEGPGSSMMIFNSPINFEGAVYHLSHNFYDVYVRVNEDQKYSMLLTCPYDILQKKTIREKWIKAVCYTLTTDPINIVDLLARGACPQLEAPIAVEDPINQWDANGGPDLMAPVINEAPAPVRSGWIAYLKLFIEEIPYQARPAGGI